jgi:hypothetical protein
MGGGVSAAAGCAHRLSADQAVAPRCSRLLKAAMVSAHVGAQHDDAALRACVAALLATGSSSADDAVAACDALLAAVNAAAPHFTPPQDAAARALPALLARVQSATLAGDVRCANAACHALGALTLQHARNAAAARAAGGVGTVMRLLRHAPAGASLDAGL